MVPNREEKSRQCQRTSLMRTQTSGAFQGHERTDHYTHHAWNRRTVVVGPIDVS